MLDPFLDPHHDGSALYVSTQSPHLGDEVRLRLRVPAGDQPDDIFVRSLADAEPRFDHAHEVHRTEHAVWYEASVRVMNPVVRYRWLLSGPDGRYRWLNGSGLVDHDVVDAHDFTLSIHPAPPSWSQGACVYQIFPDRFARSGASAPLPPWAMPADWDDTVTFAGPGTSTQVFGGTLDGIVEHLDHIVGLGFDTIYLTPFFEGRSNHRYDAASFGHVDPLLGGDEALVRLVQAAHAHGLRVIGDLTTNHSGVTHEWFKAAMADPDAPERAFYYIADDGSYACWLDAASLPKFRFGPELLGRLVDGPDSVVAHWMRPPFNLDGWRVDVANMTGRHGTDDANAQVAVAMKRTMRDADPSALLVAEHGHDATADLDGRGWDGIMNYSGFTRPIRGWLRSADYVVPRAGERNYGGVPVTTPRLPGGSFYATVREFDGATPWRALLASWSIIGSHDTPRFVTTAGDQAHAAVGAGLLYTMPGTPMVFAGEEFGLPGVNGEDSRRPMPWDDPTRQDASVLARFRALGALRAAHPALRDGSMRWLAVTDDALAFVREDADECLLVLAVRDGAGEITIDADALDAGEGARLANIDGGADDLVVSHAVITLPATGPGFQVWKV